MEKVWGKNSLTDSSADVISYYYGMAVMQKHPHCWDHEERCVIPVPSHSFNK